jgi:hypothetical protein
VYHRRSLGRPPAGRASPARRASTPEAQRLLKASTDFFASQQKFSAETRNTLEIVLKSGQKIEFNHQARLSAQRPDKLRAERSGDLVDQVFVYDGKSLTLHNPRTRPTPKWPRPTRWRPCLNSRAPSSISWRRPGT